MMRRLNKIIAVFSFLLLPLLGFAQQFRSLYFVDHSVLSHQLNPSFVPDRNYLSIPVLSKIDVSFQSNVGLSDFIYPYDHPNSDFKLTTFLSKSVSREEFLRNIHKKNIFNGNINLTPFSLGFHGFGGYNTLEVNAISTTFTELPYELFNYIKTGETDFAGTGYDIRNMGIRNTNYLNVSLGHSRSYNSKLRLGTKFKYILGINDVSAYLKQFTVFMSQDKWDISSTGQLKIAAPNVSFNTESDEYGDAIKTINLNAEKFGGWGIGFDFGATYLFNEQLTFSASLLDLGFIRWPQAAIASSLGSSVTYSGFDHLTFSSEDPEDPKAMGNQIKELSLQFGKMIRFYDEGNTKGMLTSLQTTMIVGATYTAPFYDRLEFGAMWYTKFIQHYTFTELRVATTVSPVNWYDFSLNFGISEYGAALGWVMYFNTRLSNFHVGSDYISLKLTPQFLPVDQFKMNIFFGFNIPLSKRKTDTSQKI